MGKQLKKQELQTEQTQAVAPLLREKAVATMSVDERKKTIAELKRKVLPGKCPIMFHETNREEINWENPILRESYESSSDALKSLTATTDSTLATEIFTSGVYAMAGQNTARNANVAVQSLADAAPQNATEARLCMQETALYAQGMQYLFRAESENMLPQADFYLKNAIKLLRLHNETVEARGKYCRGGEQRVVVQHVQVNDGGKAIVGGNLDMGGGGNDKK